MAFVDMQAELRGVVPKVPFPYLKTLINRAWRTVRERNLWSFQLFDGIWITPPQFSGASVTTVQGLTTVTISAGDLALLNTALAAQPYSLITQRQFRIGSGTIYNIWGFDPVGGVITLDRIYGEASQTAVSYQILQLYYVPYAAGAGYLKDFKTWISVRNQQNFIDLFTDRYTRAQVDELDPQRLWYYFPTDVVYYQTDQNPNSATITAPMYELWGGPIANYTYQLYGIRRGVDLSAGTDALPPAVGEDCVIALAKYYAYQWAEANRDLSTRSVGPDFKFLMGVAQKEFLELFKDYRRADRETVDNWYSVRRSAMFGKFWPHYNSIAGMANPGAIFG